MKKYFNFLLVLAMTLVLSSGFLFTKQVQAVDPVAGDPSDTSKIGKVICVLRGSTAEFAPGVWQVSLWVGTDKFFYVKRGPDIPLPSAQFLPDSASTASRPILTYKYGSLTDKVMISYQTPAGGDAFTSLDRNLALNPFIKIINPGNIYTASSDGEKYYPFDWSNVNDPNMPSCNDVVKNITPPSCSDGIKNQNETGVDTGGVCGTPGSGGGGGGGGASDPEYDAYKNANYGTCSDEIMNSNETGVDAGGRCSPGQLGGIGPGSSKQPIGHWYGNTSPTKISVKNNLSPVYAQFVPRALRDWNLASSVIITENGSDAAQVTIDNAYYGDVGWVGVANISYNGGHIVSAPTRINDTYMKLARYKNAEQQQFVVTHELGHAFGVGHQDPKDGEDVSASFCNENMGSVMDYTAQILGGTHSCGGATVNFGISNLNPNPNDISTLNDQYIPSH